MTLSLQKADERSKSSGHLPGSREWLPLRPGMCKNAIGWLPKKEDFGLPYVITSLLSNFYISHGDAQESGEALQLTADETKPFEEGARSLVMTMHQMHLIDELNDLAGKWRRARW